MAVPMSAASLMDGHRSAAGASRPFRHGSAAGSVCRAVQATATWSGPLAYPLSDRFMGDRQILGAVAVGHGQVALAADLLGDLLDDEIHHVASRGPGHPVRRDAGSR